MADTITQLEVEDWVREKWLPLQFGQTFHREKLRLSSGGVFDFDAVSSDRRIAASISTSAAATAGGRSAADKLMKLRADMLFLTAKEREMLQTMTRSGTERARKMTQARTLLKADQGWRDAVIATALDVSLTTVGRTRQRFVLEGWSNMEDSLPTGISVNQRDQKADVQRRRN
jgi:hypothetical protein